MTVRFLNALMAILLVMGTYGCSNDDDNQMTSRDLKKFTPISFSRSETESIARTQEFAWELLKKIDVREDGNFMMSPLSAVLNLSMLANGAQGETLSQILTALHSGINDVDALNSYAKRLTEKIESVDNSTDILIANALFTCPSYNIRDDFKSYLKNWYNAETFTIGGKETQTINDWVKTRTKDKITNLFNPIEEASAKFAVVNTLYFDAIWQSPFSVSNTINDTFHSPKGETTAQFMCKTKSVEIWQNEQFAVARLDFGNRAFCIYFVLPLEGVLLADVLPSLDEAMLSSLKNETLKVNLRIPKFEIKSHINLIDPLKDCGIVDAFDTQKADFDILAEGTGKIDLMRQACTFKIDETGVQAVGATGSASGPTAAGPIKDGGDFFLDRPFLFMIKENSSNTYLFMGKIENI